MRDRELGVGNQEGPTVACEPTGEESGKNQMKIKTRKPTQPSSMSTGEGWIPDECFKFSENG